MNKLHCFKKNFNLNSNIKNKFYGLSSVFRFTDVKIPNRHKLFTFPFRDFLPDDMDNLPFAKPRMGTLKEEKLAEKLLRRADKYREIAEQAFKDKRKEYEVTLENLFKEMEYVLTNELYEQYSSSLNIEKILYQDQKFKNLQLNETYYVPLSNSELNSVEKLFGLNFTNKISLGGKLVLKNELMKLKNDKNFKENKDFQKLLSHLNDFQPLSLEDREYLKKNFSDYYLQNINTRNLILNKGKVMMNSLTNLFNTQKEKTLVLKENLNNIAKINNISLNSQKISETKVSFHNSLKSNFIINLFHYLNTNEQEILNCILTNNELKKLMNVDDYNFRISDISLVKGLSENPNNNYTPDCYDYSFGSEEGFSINVFRRKELFENGHLEKDKYDYTLKTSKDIDNYRIVLRVTLEFQKKINTISEEDLDKLTSQNEKLIEKGKFNINDLKLKFETHYAVLDNELVLPFNKMHLGNIDYPQVLSVYTLNKETWILKDVDNSDPRNLNILQNYSNSTLIDLMQFLIQYKDENILKIYDCHYNNIDYFSKSFSNLNNHEKINKEKHKISIDNYKVIHIALETEIDKSVLYKSFCKGKDKQKALFNKKKDQFLMLYFALRIQNLTDKPYKNILNEINNFFISNRELCSSENFSPDAILKVYSHLENISPFIYNGIDLLSVKFYFRKILYQAIMLILKIGWNQGIKYA